MLYRYLSNRLLNIIRINSNFHLFSYLTASLRNSSLYSRNITDFRRMSSPPSFSLFFNYTVIDWYLVNPSSTYPKFWASFYSRHQRYTSNNNSSGIRGLNLVESNSCSACPLEFFFFFWASNTTRAYSSIFLLTEWSVLRTLSLKSPPTSASTDLTVMCGTWYYAAIAAPLWDFPANDSPRRTTLTVFNSSLPRRVFLQNPSGENS